MTNSWAELVRLREAGEKAHAEALGWASDEGASAAAAGGSKAKTEADAEAEAREDAEWLAGISRDLDEWVRDVLTVLRVLVSSRLPWMVKAVEEAKAERGRAGGAERAAAAAAAAAAASPVAAATDAGAGATSPPGGSESRTQLADWEMDMLLCPAQIERLIGAMELNSIELKIDSPVRNYLQVLSHLPKTAAKGQAEGGAAAGKKKEPRRRRGGASQLPADVDPLSPYGKALSLVGPLLERIELCADERQNVAEMAKAAEKARKQEEEGEDYESDEDSDSDGLEDSDSEDEEAEEDEDGNPWSNPLNKRRLRKLIPIVKGTACFAMVSMMNHSCDPSVQIVYADGSSAALALAMRPIKENEELSINYVDVRQPYPVRKADLTFYGFECQCPLCAEEIAREKWREEAGFSGRSKDKAATKPGKN
jgi:hypothetical protein